MVEFCNQLVGFSQIKLVYIQVQSLWFFGLELMWYLFLLFKLMLKMLFPGQLWATCYGSCACS